MNAERESHLQAVPCHSVDCLIDSHGGAEIC